MGHLVRLYDSANVNQRLRDIRGRLAYDVGANGGHLANLLSYNFEKVVALEPCLESFKAIALHENPKIVPLLLAASDHYGEETFRETALTESLGELFTGFSIDHWGDTVRERTVPCVMLDDLVEQHGMPDFVKIDTEGHEAKVVMGAHEIFMTHPRFVIEIHDAQWGDEIESYFDFIELPFRIEHHEAYRRGTRNYNNHYWMVNP